MVVFFDSDNSAVIVTVGRAQEKDGRGDDVDPGRTERIAGVGGFGVSLRAGDG
jgi:hypothetical protein